jgi:hypothetical protein
MAVGTKAEAVVSLQTSVLIYQAARHHIPKDGNFNTERTSDLTRFTYIYKANKNK